MTRIKQANKVQTTCPKHGFVEHIEYIKEDGKIVYRCNLCHTENPLRFPIYGRQQPGFTPHKLDETKPQQIGRQVA